MGFDADIYRQAMQTVTQRRMRAEQDALILKSRLYTELDGFEQADKALITACSQIPRAFLNGGNMDELRKDCETLQKKRADILAAAGYDADYTEPKFHCKICNDSGYVDGIMCECAKSIAKQIAYRKLSENCPLENSTFSTFSLDKYPNTTDEDGRNPRRCMESIFKFCKKYVENFNPKSDSLLLFGATGLGKTHLSLSIANEVINKGFGVIYGPVSHILNEISDEHFSNSSENTKRQHVLGCDLLILDDLGSEFNNSFISSVIYDIINSRILSGKPTIINTNLTFEEIESRYSERVLSRIAGCYKLFEFVGQDLRMQ